MITTLWLHYNLYTIVIQIVMTVVRQAKINVIKVTKKKLYGKKELDANVRGKKLAKQCEK